MSSQNNIQACCLHSSAFIPLTSSILHLPSYIIPLTSAISHQPSDFFHQTSSKTFPHEGPLESVLFSESSLSLRVRSSLRNEIRDAVEAERVLRVIPKIGQTCPELRTVFALSLCFVSLSGERNEKESLLMVRRGRGWLSLAAQLQKFLVLFQKRTTVLTEFLPKAISKQGEPR